MANLYTDDVDAPREELDPKLTEANQEKPPISTLMWEITFLKRGNNALLEAQSTLRPPLSRGSIQKKILTGTEAEAPAHP